MTREQLDALLADSSFAWWEWDVRRNTVRFNERKATMLGYAPGELASRGYQAFTELLHPEDYEKTMDAMRVVLSNRTDLYQTDYRIRAKDGTFRWYMDRGYVLERDTDGSPLVIRGVVIDLGREGQETDAASALAGLIRQSAAHYDHDHQCYLTVCSGCRKVRAENGQWMSITDKLAALIGDTISHGICPECITVLYPELAPLILRSVSGNDCAR